MKFGNYNLTSAAQTEGKSKSLLLFRFKKVKTTANQIVGKVHHTIGTFRRMRSESPLSFRAALFDKTQYNEAEHQLQFDPEDFPSASFYKEDPFVSPFAGGADIKQVVENQRLIGPGRPRSSVENFYTSLRNLNEVRTVSTVGRSRKQYSRNERAVDAPKAQSQTISAAATKSSSNTGRRGGSARSMISMSNNVNDETTVTSNIDKDRDDEVHCDSISKRSKENMMEYLNAKQIDESIEYEVLKEYFDTYSYSDICMDTDFKSYLTRKNYNDILDMMGPENGTLLSRGSMATSANNCKGSLDRRCRQTAKKNHQKQQHQQIHNGANAPNGQCKHMNNHQHNQNNHHYGRSASNTTAATVADPQRRRRRSESSVHESGTLKRNEDHRQFHADDEDVVVATLGESSAHRVLIKPMGRRSVSGGDVRGSGYVTRNLRSPHLHEFHGEMKENLITLRKYATIESIYNHHNNTKSNASSADPYSLVDDPWPPGGHCQHMPPPPTPRTTTTLNRSLSSSSAVPPLLPPINHHHQPHIKQQQGEPKQPKLVKTLQHNYSKSKSTPSLKYFSDINDHLDMIDIRRNEAPSRIENFSKISATNAAGDATLHRSRVFADGEQQQQQHPPNNINEHYSTFPTQKLVKNKNFTNSLKRIKNVFNNNNSSNANRSNSNVYKMRKESFNTESPEEEGGYDYGDDERNEDGDERSVKLHDKNCFYAKSYCEIIQLCKQFFSETDLTNMKLSSKNNNNDPEVDYDYDERDQAGEDQGYFPAKKRGKGKSSTLPRCKSMPNISQVHDGKPKKFCSYGYKKIILGYVKSKGFNNVTNYVESKFGKVIDRALNENHIISTGNVTLPRAKKDKNWTKSVRADKKLDVNESIRRFLYEDAFKTFDYVKSDPARRYLCSSCGQWTEGRSSAIYERSDEDRFAEAVNRAKPAAAAMRKYATVRYKKNPQLFNSLSWRNRTDYNKKLNKLDRGYRDQIRSEEMATMVPPQLLQGKEDVLFGNLTELYNFHNDVFLKDLENCISTTELVALCFVQRRDTFYRLYSYYCQNIPRSEQLRETLVDTHLFLQECQKRLGHKLPLAAYLLKPVQRITKYQLLLKDLLRFSDNGTCAKELQKALDCMLIVLKCVNDSMHQIAITGFPADLSQQGELLMQDSFTVWTDSKKDMRLRMKTQQRHIFLYQKALLFCKHASKNGHNKSTYQYKHYVKMSQIGLTESVRGDARRFEIWLQGRQEVHTIQATSVEVKNKWVAEIKRVLFNQLEELKGEKIKQYGLNNNTKQLQHAASWDPTTDGGGGMAGPKLNRDSKNLSIGEAVTMQPNCPPEPALAEVQPQQEVIGASSSDYSNSEDEYTHIEEPRPGAMYVSLADYCAMSETEVSIKERDLVELLKVGCAGWWFVKLLGGDPQEGWAPAAYLSPVKGNSNYLNQY